MDNKFIEEGIERFAQRNGAIVKKADEVLYEVTFPGERYSAFIGIELFGLALSYGTYCGVLPDAALAPTLLMKNWGGVDGTCFYISVQIQDGQAWLVLETKQLLDSIATSEHVASLLMLCRSQWLQAKQAVAEAFQVR